MKKTFCDVCGEACTGTSYELVLKWVEGNEDGRLDICVRCASKLDHCSQMRIALIRGIREAISIGPSVQKEP